jgi:hypothetical protein
MPGDLRFGSHMPLFFKFIFLSYDTLQKMTGSFHTILYDLYGSHHIDVMMLGQPGFNHEISGIKFTVSSENF